MENLLKEEDYFLEALEVSDDDIKFMEETLEKVKEVKKSTNAVKELIYFSDSIIIVKFVYKSEDELDDDGSRIVIRGEEYNILQVYYRETGNSNYHYCKVAKLENSLLLNLINKGDSIGNRKSYL